MSTDTKELFVKASRHIYRKFPLDGRIVVGTDIVLSGEAIMRFLKGAHEVVVMAATLGFEADRKIEAVQTCSMSEAFLLDEIANEAIEEVCRCVQGELSKRYRLTRHRFSCGFGDFPLETQPHILEALDAKKRIGLYCNESNLLIPMKSVTAFMGVLQ